MVDPICKENRNLQGRYIGNQVQMVPVTTEIQLHSLMTTGVPKDKLSVVQLSSTEKSKNF